MARAATNPFPYNAGLGNVARAGAALAASAATSAMPAAATAPAALSAALAAQPPACEGCQENPLALRHLVTGARASSPAKGPWPSCKLWKCNI